MHGEDCLSVSESGDSPLPIRIVGPSFHPLIFISRDRCLSGSESGILASDPRSLRLLISSLSHWLFPIAPLPIVWKHLGCITGAEGPYYFMVAGFGRVGYAYYL